MIRRYLPALVAFLVAAGMTLLVTQRARTQDRPKAATLCPLVLVPRHLAMDAEQHRRVEGLTVEFQQECRALRTRMRERRRDLFRLLAAPRPDDAAIAARMGEIAGLQAALQQRMIRHILAVRETLTPEQQRKLFRLLDEAMKQDVGRME